MAKRLLLLRHAQSDPKFRGKDKERPLTPQGVSEAAALGYYIRDHGLSPDYVLCSDAWRTRETLEQIRENLYRELSPNQMALMPSLYTSEVENYLEQIQDCEEEPETLLLIGHRPCIPVLARMLIHSADRDAAPLFERYAPATLTILSCDIEQWSDLRYGGSTLVDIVNPNDFFCPAYQYI